MRGRFRRRSPAMGVMLAVLVWVCFVGASRASDIAPRYIWEVRVGDGFVGVVDYCYFEPMYSPLGASTIFAFDYYWTVPLSAPGLAYCAVFALVVFAVAAWRLRHQLSPAPVSGHPVVTGGLPPVVR